MKDSVGVLCTILFYVFFSKLILNSKIYIHQIISIIIISLCALILLFIDVFKVKLNNFVASLLYYILIYRGLYTLYDVLIKKHFETHLTDPYYLMFFIGLFSLILVIPLDLFV